MLPGQRLEAWISVCVCVLAVNQCRSCKSRTHTLRRSQVSCLKRAWEAAVTAINQWKYRSKALLIPMRGVGSHTPLFNQDSSQFDRPVLVVSLVLGLFVFVLMVLPDNSSVDTFWWGDFSIKHTLAWEWNHMQPCSRGKGALRSPPWSYVQTERSPLSGCLLYLDTSDKSYLSGCRHKNKRYIRQENIVQTCRVWAPLI